MLGGPPLRAPDALEVGELGAAPQRGVHEAAGPPVPPTLILL